MTATTNTPRCSWDPPGAGTWLRDGTHFTRPATALMQELFPPSFVQGYREGTARYGMLLDHHSWAFVNGWGYVSPTMFSPSRGDLAPESPEVTARLAVAADAVANQRWRDDLSRWERVDKPRHVAANRALTGMEPSGLGARELLAHIASCRANLVEAIVTHHRYNVTTMIPVGDFLVHAQQWSQQTTGALLALLPQRTGKDMATEADGLRPINGYDIGEATLSELASAMPVPSAASKPQGSDANDQVADVRADVPQRHRASFDQLLDAARAVNALRDERALVTDLWALGLLRRALLTLGETLVDRDAIHERTDVLECAWHEIAAFAEGHDGPDADLQRRAAWRVEAEIDDAPPFLGPTPSRPELPQWLPASARRIEEAFDTAVAALFMGAAANAGPLSGLCASPGRYRGVARLVRTLDDLGRVGPGEIVVAPATTPAFAAVFPLLGAVVTERGGLLSHAAVLGRELAIPTIVGCTGAMKRIPDGTPITVNADEGVVEVAR